MPKCDSGSIHSVQESEGMGGDTQEDMQEKIPVYDVIVLAENHTKLKNGAAEHAHILGDGTRRQAAWTHCKDTQTGSTHVTSFFAKHSCTFPSSHTHYTLRSLGLNAGMRHLWQRLSQ